jgi:hypothetical protein
MLKPETFQRNKNLDEFSGQFRAIFITPGDTRAETRNPGSRQNLMDSGFLIGGMMSKKPEDRVIRVPRAKALALPVRSCEMSRFARASFAWPVAPFWGMALSGRENIFGGGDTF